jgi:hypothetical protein
MPYIENSFRKRLDIHIEKLVDSLFNAVSEKDISEFDANDLLNCSGNLNYVMTRICSSLLVNKPTYAKVAIITGVLENVKQEFYRRVASPYEDKKIEQNGDVKGYLSEETNLFHSS